MVFTMDDENSTKYLNRKSDDKEVRNDHLKIIGPTTRTVVSNTTGGSGSSCDDTSTDSVDSLPKSPDGGWGWMVVISSFMAHVIADGCGFSVGVLFTEWLDFFGESKAKTALVSSLFVSMPAICGPIASIITNKFGCRLTTVAGGVIAAAGCLLSCLANSIEVLCITFGIISGFGLALIYVPAVVVVAFYFEKKRAFATGISVAGSGIGTFIMAPVTERLIDAYSWRGAVVVIGGIMLNLVVCGALFRPLVSYELRKKRQKYLRSLERFSRTSSRRQSREGIERRSNYDDADDLGIKSSEEVLHHSLILLPTYLNSHASPASALPDLYAIEGRRSSKSHSDMTLLSGAKRNGQRNHSTQERVKFEAENVKPNGPDDCFRNSKTEQQKKSILVDGKHHRTTAFRSHIADKERRKIRFPEHLVPRRNTDIFYRGSLLKAGFLLNRGQSSSCPDIFVRTHSRPSLIMRLRSIQLRFAMHRICDVTDFSIFTNKMFLLFCVHSMLLYVSYDIPYVYIPSKAEGFNIPDNMASWLVSSFGIASTVGQIVMGYLGDRSWINCLYFYIAMITITGLATLVVPALTTFASLAAYCAVFGFFISANFALTTIIVVELLGMDQLTNAYGFISLAEGLANLVGPPFAGWIIDYSGSYDLAFYLAGAVISVSGLILLIVPCVRKCRRLARKQNSDEEDPAEVNSAVCDRNNVGT